MSAPVRIIESSSLDTPRHAASPSRVILVVAGGSVMLRVRAAFRGRALIEHASTIRSARERLRHQQVYALLVEAVDSTGVSTEALVVESRSQFPRTAVLGCVSSRRTMSDGDLALVRAGANDLLAFDELDLPHTVQTVVDSARLSCLADVVWPSIASALDPVLAPFVQLALRLAYRPLDVDGVARALGIHRKTLWQRCQQRDTLTPRELLGWCRVLAAAFALDDLGRTVDSIADELDFPSPSALRNLLQRYLGLTPTELRDVGASEYATARLAQSLLRARV